MFQLFCGDGRKWKVLLHYEKFNFRLNKFSSGLDTDFHNQQVLFPSVTICPLEAFDSLLVNETSSQILPDNEESFEQFIPVLKSLSQLTYENLGLTYEALMNVSNDLKLGKDNLRQLAFKVRVKCEDLLEICKYKDEEIPCCEHFSPLYSEQGFCYSFNSRYFGQPEDE